MSEQKRRDGLTEIIEQALAKMPELGEWQKRFLDTLFNTVLLLRGKVNFSQLGKHSELNEKTFRRWFRRDFDFVRFNLNCIEQRLTQGELVAAMDASYLPKSGKKT